DTMNQIAPIEITTGEFAAILRHDFEACHATQPCPARRVPDLDPDERERLIAAHIARHGVTRSVSFGVNQPAIETLRACGMTVLSSRCVDKRRPWIINGRRSNTHTLWRLANAERRKRGLPTIKREK
ncbi:MAG: hypothetical protein AB7D00_12805, partial [Rhodospirillaceae bacterium]